MSFIGIDIGSSQVKAVAFSADGETLAAARRSYRYTVPAPGAMELDGEAVLRAAFEVLQECAAKVKRLSPVRAIACSSQGEAFSMLDADGRILAPAMISGDIRPAAVIDEFVAVYGSEKLYRQT